MTIEDIGKLYLCLRLTLSLQFRFAVEKVKDNLIARKTTVKRIYMLFDRFFAVGGEEILKNRRVVFVPAIIIFAGLAVVRFAVGPTSQALAAGRDVVMTLEDQPVTIPVQADEMGPNGHPLKIKSVSQGKWGKTVVNDNGTITYLPNADFCGIDVFTYSVINSAGQNVTRNVRVTVSGTNDAPKIVSNPVTQVATDLEYVYDVNAADPDPGDRLTYSLIAAPAGMTIDPTTGLIRWTPAKTQIEIQQVTVKVADSSSIESDIQSFTVTVGQTGPFRRAVLTAEKALGRNDVIDLLGSNSAGSVHQSDDDRYQTTALSDCCYEFTDATIPIGSKITSVVMYIEHFEDKGFPPGKLAWMIGTGWPANPTMWVSMKAPLREEARWESTDSWDVSTFVDTPEKVNAMQLRIENGCKGEPKASFVDYVYVVVEWEQK